MQENNLGEKKTLFCEYFARCRDPAQAATLAGYRIMPERTGMKLLREQKVREKIDELSRMTRAGEAAAGLERIAFGSAADAIRLAFCEDAPDENELNKMDLCCVAEIKRVKGGTEIKFFDRIKALEALAALSPNESGDSGMRDFVDAMRQGVSLIGREEEN